MNDTAWHVLILVLGAVAFLVGALVTDRVPPHPLAAIRLRLVATGLFLWILATILVAAGVL